MRRFIKKQMTGNNLPTVGKQSWMGTAVSQKVLYFVLLGLISFVLMGCILASIHLFDKIEDSPVGFNEKKLGTVDRDVVYCTTEDGTELKMDVYYPEVENSVWPLMMHVHGGGWVGGSKDVGFLFPFFTEFGVLGVEIDYRLSPDVQFPAHIEDVKCAVRYLRANAELYNLDPDRFLATGGSAGGHLVSLLGTTSDSGEFNVGEYPDVSSAVQAVIAISALTNLADMLCWENGVEELALPVFGTDAICGDVDSILEEASPIHYVSSEDVPFLILAGTADPLVPYEQSQILHKALQEAGVDSTLFLVEGGDHDLVVPDDESQGRQYFMIIIDFMERQLALERPKWLDEH